MSTVSSSNKRNKKDSVYNMEYNMLYYLTDALWCTVQVTLSTLCPFILRFETILTFGGILQHGGVYILVYSIGRYSIRCAQPSRCWRYGPEGLQSTWMIRILTKNHWNQSFWKHFRDPEGITLALIRNLRLALEKGDTDTDIDTLLSEISIPILILFKLRMSILIRYQ